MAGGVLWILVVAVLLAGVVAMNVSVLRLNVELDRLGGERARLRAENAVLQARLSQAAAAVEPRARRLKLVPADPIYIRLPPRAR